MRDWDDEDEFDGMQERDGKEHEHHFDRITGICAICLKTREDIRREW